MGHDSASASHPGRPLFLAHWLLSFGKIMISFKNPRALRQIVQKRGMFGLPDPAMKGKDLVEFEQQKINHAASKLGPSLYGISTYFPLKF